MGTIDHGRAPASTLPGLSVARSAGTRRPRGPASMAVRDEPATVAHDDRAAGVDGTDGRGMDGEHRGLLTSGDLARLTGNTVRTVRFYEERGLLVPAARSAGGHRLYTEDQVQLLEWISDLRDAGIQLAAISRVIELRARAEGRHESTQEIRGLLDRELVELRRRTEVIRRVQAELTASADLLAACSDCDSDGQEDTCRGCETRARVPGSRSLQFLW